MSVISSARCGHEHQDWLKALDHFKQDFLIAENQLLEISRKYENHDIRAWVEHFQNQFFLQRNNMDEVSHKIRVHDEEVVKKDLGENGRLETGLFTEHESLKEEFYNIERVIAELKHDFSIFLAGKL